MSPMGTAQCHTLSEPWGPSKGYGLMFLRRRMGKPVGQKHRLCSYCFRDLLQGTSSKSLLLSSQGQTRSCLPATSRLTRHSCSLTSTWTQNPCHLCSTVPNQWWPSALLLPSLPPPPLPLLRNTETNKTPLCVHLFLKLPLHLHLDLQWSSSLICAISALPTPPSTLRCP